MKFRKMKFMTAVAALTCAQAMASEVTYTWDAANPVTSLGDDVRIELNDSAVFASGLLAAGDLTLLVYELAPLDVSLVRFK